MTHTRYETFGFNNQMGQNLNMSSSCMTAKTPLIYSEKKKKRMNDFESNLLSYKSYS